MNVKHEKYNSLSLLIKRSNVSFNFEFLSKTQLLNSYSTKWMIKNCNRVNYWVKNKSAYFKKKTTDWSRCKRFYEIITFFFPFRNKCKYKKDCELKITKTKFTHYLAFQHSANSAFVNMFWSMHIFY